MNLFDLTDIFVIATLVILSIVFVFAGVLSMIRVRKQVNRPKPKALTEAENLYQQSFYSLCAVRAFAAVEIALKETVTAEGTVFELIDLAVKKRLMSDQLRNKAHSLRMLRNKLVHEADIKFTQTDANNYLKFTREILVQLNYEI